MPGFNPFRYRFPYTNINDINLDWIIKKVKTLSDAVASIDVSRMDEIAQQAETAQQDADTALVTAQSAETTANSVQGIANNALTTAQSAETTANSVQGIANNALTTAQSAQTTATQAASDAQTANNNALSAISIGDYATVVARQAQTATTALDASKADKVQNATSGNFAGLDANGNLTDSGRKNSDYAASSAIAAIESSPAAQAHAVGDYIVYNGQLYKVTAAISVGESLTVGTNVEATNTIRALNNLIKTGVVTETLGSGGNASGPSTNVTVITAYSDRSYNREAYFCFILSNAAGTNYLFHITGNNLNPIENQSVRVIYKYID